MSAAATPTRRARTAVASVIGLAWGWAIYVSYIDIATASGARRMPGDWLWHYRAARALLDGHDPYAVVRAVGNYPWSANYLYPLPAALAAVPFSVLPVPWGAAVFVAVITAGLAFAVTARAWWPLWLFASSCYFWAAFTAQLSPLLVSAALIPALSGLLVLKPTVGVALAVYRPSRWLVVGATGLCAVAWLVDPRWVSHWLDAIRTNPLQAQYRPALVTSAGPLLALALLRWRRPEARLLLALACVPTNYFFYDQLPLFLVTRRWWEAAGLAALSYIAFALFTPGSPTGMSVVAATAAFAQPVVALLYLPCLLMVLARPNVGPLPPSVESFASRLPRWLRGEVAVTSRREPALHAR